MLRTELLRIMRRRGSYWTACLLGLAAVATMIVVRLSQNAEPGGTDLLDAMDPISTPALLMAVIVAALAGSYDVAQGTMRYLVMTGVPRSRIITRHMIPSFMSHIIASATLAIPGMILGETALSFLSLGLRPPVVSWGVMLQDAMNITTIANMPWLLLPGAAVVVTVLAFNFLGDGLRDAADPYR